MWTTLLVLLATADATDDPIVLANAVAHDPPHAPAPVENDYDTPITPASIPLSSPDAAAAPPAPDPVDAPAQDRAERETTPRPEPLLRTPADRPFLYGLVTLESRLLSEGKTTEHAEIQSTTFRAAMPPPTTTKDDFQVEKWMSLYGEDVLRMARQNLATGKVIAELERRHRPTRYTLRREDSLCVELDQERRDPLELKTWDDATRARVSSGDLRARASNDTLVLVGGEHRSVWTHLAPGESATLVEILDDAPRKTQRKLTVTRGARRTTLAERRGRQIICRDRETDEDLLTDPTLLDPP